MNNGALSANPAVPETSDRCLEFLGLDQNPFSLAPDIVNFFSSRRIESTIVEVLQLVESRMGFALLYGEVGLGKTTISRRILTELDHRNVDTSLVFNTFFQGADLIRAINRDFGVEIDSSDLQSQLSALNDFLLERRRQGKNCVIIIDDAQNLSIESLELVRQISNMETGIDKIVQIILIGQPELEAKLNQHALRQLKSRIVLKRSFKPLSFRETTAYIRSKIARAGYAPLVEIDQRAIRRVHEHTGGFPRRINVTMGRCLYAAVACHSHRITNRVARMAIQDMEESLEPPVSRPKSRSVAWLSVVGALITVPLALAYVGDRRFDFDTGRWWPLNPGVESSPATGLSTSPGNETRDILREQPDSIAVPISSDTLEDLDPPRTDDTLSPDVAALIDEDTPVLDFLASYGLEHHFDLFSDALVDKDFSTATRSIARDSGLQLVAVPSTIDLGAQSFDRLLLGDQPRRDTLQLLFWRPTFWRDEDFHYFYKKPQIVALQTALRNAGHYRHVVDGIAGDRTTAAIDEFQRNTGLMPTGVPDIATLFMLEVHGLTPQMATRAFPDNPD